MWSFQVILGWCRGQKKALHSSRLTCIPSIGFKFSSIQLRSRDLEVTSSFKTQEYLFLRKVSGTAATVYCTKFCYTIFTNSLVTTKNLEMETEISTKVSFNLPYVMWLKDLTFQDIALIFQSIIGKVWGTVMSNLVTISSLVLQLWQKTAR